MRGLPQVAAAVRTVVALFVLASSWLPASEGAQEPPADEAARHGPAIDDVRGQAGLFGGFATAGADGLENGGLFGANAAFFFSRRLGIEAGVQRRSLDVVATSSNQLSGGSLDSTVVTGGLVVRFPAGARVAPYLVAGVAYFSNTFESASAVVGQLAALNFRLTEELKSAVGFNVGAGADFLVADRFALFGEVRYLGGSTDTRAELTDTIGGVAAEIGGSQDLNGLELKGGVRFVFAASGRKVPEP